MAKLIDRLNDKIKKVGINPASAAARVWLKAQMAGLAVSKGSILNDPKRTVTSIAPGRMYFYAYDPKHKDTLPLYDRFPLVIPVEMYSDGLLGLNLHYIRPNLRLALLDKLYETNNNKDFDETTKMQISYNLLQGAARFKNFEPCLKRYLNAHIRSRIIEIPAHEWEVAALLPVDQFVKGRPY